MERKRITKEEYQKLKSTINVQEFKDFFKVNCNDYVCNHYNITISTMYKLLKDFNIALTEEEKRKR